MRNSFVAELVEVARADASVMLLTADLGYNVLDVFAHEFPDRFLNVGVAEQNMAGIATGLAMTGRRVFIYSIATFATLRCFEQFRNGPALHNLPVCVVGVGGGYAYGNLGPSHFALEDISAMRALGGVQVVAPADPGQTRSAVRAISQWNGPAYLRLGKGGNPAVPGLEGRFGWNQPETIRQGDDLLFIATGAVVPEALAAAERLALKGIQARVAVQAHLAAEPTAELAELLKGYRGVLTVEEGVVTGGLGALVAQTIAQGGLGCRLQMAGARGGLAGPVGSREFMLASQGLDADSLADTALGLFKRKTTLARNA
jgi:transketolase